MWMRGVLEYVGMALSTLRRSLGRSALTVLGLAIGVAAFIAMLSFGRSARRSVLDQFEVLGTRVITLLPELPSLTRRKAIEPLGERDVQALRDEVLGTAEVVPSVVDRTLVSARGLQHPTEVVGTTPEFTDIHDWDVVAGGPFDAVDEEANAKVCLLGRTPAEELFGEPDAALGQRLTIGTGVLSCRVVGLLATKGSSTSGKDLDDIVLVPLSTYELYFGLPTGYSSIEVRATEANLRAVQEEMRRALRQAHRLRAGEADDFRLKSADAIVALAGRIASTLESLLAAIAGVSLLVGGIGIMNIQLVSVAERTHEIGVRAAVGASPEQILQQFLIEALILSTVGTALGVAAGWGLSLTVAHLMHWPRTLSLGATLLGGGFGMSTGLLFGYLPARRAAALDPLAALRER